MNDYESINIIDKVYEDGYQVGYSHGYDVGYDDGFDDGQSEEFIVTENMLDEAYDEGYVDGLTFAAHEIEKRDAIIKFLMEKLYG